VGGATAVERERREAGKERSRKRKKQEKKEAGKAKDRKSKRREKREAGRDKTGRDKQIGVTPGFSLFLFFLFLFPPFLLYCFPVPAFPVFSFRFPPFLLFLFCGLLEWCFVIRRHFLFLGEIIESASAR
jgi:hypothetical protein